MGTTEDHGSDASGTTSVGTVDLKLEVVAVSYTHLTLPTTPYV